MKQMIDFFKQKLVLMGIALLYDIIVLTVER